MSVPVFVMFFIFITVEIEGLRNYGFKYFPCDFFNIGREDAIIFQYDNVHLFTSLLLEEKQQ
jgi:hypothetical protein